MISVLRTFLNEYYLSLYHFKHVIIVYCVYKIQQLFVLNGKNN